MGRICIICRENKVIRACLHQFPVDRERLRPHAIPTLHRIEYLEPTDELKDNTDENFKTPEMERMELSLEPPLESRSFPAILSHGQNKPIINAETKFEQSEIKIKEESVDDCTASEGANGELSPTLLPLSSQIKIEETRMQDDEFSIEVEVELLDNFADTMEIKIEENDVTDEKL